MSNRMLAYVDLNRPYRFERTIIVFVALVLALAVLLAGGWLVAIEELTAFGPRAFYFLYLLALLVLVVALVRWPRIAGALLTLTLVDFGWGVGSYAGDGPALDALYERNIRAISAIDHQRGVSAIRVGQLLNRAQLSGDGRYGWLPLVRDRDLWPLQQNFNALLARTAKELGDIYVDVPTDSFGDADLAPVVRDACR